MSKRTTKPVVRWNEQDIINAIGKRCSAPEWAFFPQVRNGTGFAQLPRTADAVAMNCYPSRGLEVHGFEVKTNRNDFLNELKDPEKAESIAKYCDRWWLVMSDSSYVMPGELPVNWGMLSMHGGVLRCDKEAPKLDAVPLDRLFVAALLRNQAICPNEEETRKYNEGREYGKEVAGSNYKRLKKEVDEFERVSGVRITDQWYLGDIGLAVKTLVGMQYDVNRIGEAACRARKIADTLDEMLDKSGLRTLDQELKDKSGNPPKM